MLVQAAAQLRGRPQDDFSKCRQSLSPPSVVLDSGDGATVIV